LQKPKEKINTFIIFDFPWNLKKNNDGASSQKKQDDYHS